MPTLRPCGPSCPKNAEVAYLRGMANTIPEVEAQLVRLNRDYTVVNGIRNPVEATRVGTHEPGSTGRQQDVTFKVLDPPRTPLQPRATRTDSC